MKLRSLFSKNATKSAPLVNEVSAPKHGLLAQFRAALGARTATPRKRFGIVPAQLQVHNAMSAVRERGDVSAYAELLERVQAASPKFASVWATRRQAVESAYIRFKPLDGAQNAAINEALEAFLASPVVRGALGAIQDGRLQGVSVLEKIWEEETPGKPRGIAKFVPVPPRNLTFDESGRTPFLLPDEQGGEPLELDSLKFVVHAPVMSWGHIYEAGLAFPLMPFAYLSPAVVGMYLGLVERYGEPIRVGTMPDPEVSRLTPDEEEQLAAVMVEALQSLGSDAWGLLPPGAKIELIEAASSNATGALHQALLRYADDIIAGLILGGSLTSGTALDGSSTNALGAIHNEVRLEYVRADREAVALTIQRDIVEPWLRLNYGEYVPVPEIYLESEASRDVQATIDNVAKLVPLGLRVSQNEMREMLGLRAPDDDNDVLEAPAPAPSPLFTKQSAASTHKFAVEDAPEGDEIDALIEALDESEIDAKLMQILSTARTQSELQNALLSLVKNASEAAPKFTEAAAAACTCCEAAGKAGVALGGK